MIKEVLVVEGKMDVLSVSRAVEADCIITGGFTLSPRTLKNIEMAYNKRGIIILTDPDPAGERIRTFLSKRFPNAKHAFIPKEDATDNGDIGIEQAKPPAIKKALDNVRTMGWESTNIFNASDLLSNGLNGSIGASEKRAKAGAALGIGFANAKTFLKRLNHYGVSREEFERVMEEINCQYI